MKRKTYIIVKNVKGCQPQNMISMNTKVSAESAMKLFQKYADDNGFNEVFTIREV